MISEARSFSSLIPTDFFLWPLIAILYSYYGYISKCPNRGSTAHGASGRQRHGGGEMNLFLAANVFFQCHRETGILVVTTGNSTTDIPLPQIPAVHHRSKKGRSDD